MEQLPEYLCLKEKEDVYNCTIIDTEQDFSNIFQNIIDNQSNYVFRSVNEAKFKLYSSAQRQWIWNDLSNKYTSYKDLTRKCGAGLLICIRGSGKTRKPEANK